MANQVHLDKLKEGVTAWNAWRTENMQNYQLEIDLSGADFTKMNLSHANFMKVNLAGTNFSWATLRGADFYRANVASAKFPQANLIGANFDKANCQHADFKYAKMNSVKFRSADCKYADFRQVDMGLLGLDNADMEGVKTGPYRVEWSPAYAKAKEKDNTLTYETFIARLGAHDAKENQKPIE
jgi:uncharacterized protein YjbI with pentapeptide repeats